MLEHFVIAGVASVALFIGWWWVWVPVVCLYAWYYDGWWIVIVAVLIDGYYGAFSAVPILSMATLALVIVVTMIRPLIYTHD